MAKGAAAAAAAKAASEVQQEKIETPAPVVGAYVGPTKRRYRHELPEGREVTKVKLRDGSVPLVGWHVQNGIDATKDVRIVLSGPLLYVERIMPGAHGKRVRKLGAVPVTGILAIAFPDEPAIE